MSTLQENYIYYQNQAWFGYVSGPEERLKWQRLANMTRGRLSKRGVTEDELEELDEQAIRCASQIQLNDKIDELSSRDWETLPEEDIAYGGKLRREQERRLKIKQEFKDLSDEQQAEKLLKIQQPYQTEDVGKDDMSEWISYHQHLADAEPCQTAYQELLKAQKKEKEKEELAKQEEQQRKEAEEQRKQQEEEEERSPENRAWSALQDDLADAIGRAGTRIGIEYGALEGEAYLAKVDRAQQLSVDERSESIRKLNQKINELDPNDYYDAQFIQRLKDDRLIYSYAQSVDHVGKLPKRYQDQMFVEKAVQAQNRAEQIHQPQPPQRYEPEKLTKVPEQPDLINVHQAGADRARQAAKRGKGFLGQESERMLGQICAIHENFRALRSLYRQENPPHENFFNRLYLKHNQRWEEHLDKRLNRQQAYLYMLNPPDENGRVQSDFTPAQREKIMKQKQEWEDKKRERHERRVNKFDYTLSGQQRIDRKNGEPEQNRKSVLEQNLEEHPSQYPLHGLSQEKPGRNGNPVFVVSSAPLSREAVHQLAGMSPAEFQKTAKDYPLRQLRYLTDTLQKDEQAVMEQDDPRWALLNNPQNMAIAQQLQAKQENKVDRLASLYNLSDLQDKESLTRQKMMDADLTTAVGQKKITRYQKEVEMLHEARQQKELKNATPQELIAQYAKREAEIQEQRETNPKRANELRKENIPYAMQLKRMSLDPQKEAKAYLTRQKQQQTAPEKAPAKGHPTGR